MTYFSIAQEIAPLDDKLWFEKGTITTDKIFSKSDDYCPVLRVRMLSGDFEDEKLLSENSYVNMLDHFSHCTTERSTNDYEVILKSHGVGKFGRCLGELFYHKYDKSDLNEFVKVSINNQLIEEGHGVPYFGGKR